MSKCRAPGGRRFSLARNSIICDFELDSRFSDPQRVPHPLRHLSIFRLLRLPDTSIRTPFLRGLRRNNSPGSRIPLAGLPCCGAAECSGCFRLPQHAHPQTRAQAHSTERAAFARKRSGYVPQRIAHGQTAVAGPQIRAGHFGRPGRPGQGHAIVRQMRTGPTEPNSRQSWTEKTNGAQ